MRDPARIDRMLRKLAAVWHSSPDLRLAQIVVCCTPCFDGHNQASDVFYAEDDVVEQALTAMIPRGCGYEHLLEDLTDGE